MSNNRLFHIPLILKLSVMISLLVISGIAAVSIAMLSKHRDLQEQQVTDLGHAMAQQLATSSTEFLFTDSLLSLQLIVTNFVKLPRVQSAVVLDNHLQIKAQEGEQKSYKAIQDLVQQLHPNLAVTSQAVDGGHLLVASSIKFREVIGGYVFIVIQTETLFAPYGRTLERVLLVCTFVAFIGLIAAYFISRHFSRPIDQLLAATTQMGKGVFSNDTKVTRNDELGWLLDAINTMGVGLFRKKQLESLLSRVLSRDVADQVIKELDTVNVSGERVEATVLFVDIAGFTGMSEQLTPEQVAELLNEYFSYFTICSSMYFGTIDKFIGDCAMVIFGAPKKNKLHQFNAVACAVLMQKLSRTMNQSRRVNKQPEVQFRIGINTGQMLAGLLGNQQRMEYTVVGDSVNLASRLCHEASPGEIIVTDKIYTHLFKDGKVIGHKHQSIAIKGKKKPIDTYLINDVSSEYQLTMDDLIRDVLDSRRLP